MRTVRVRRSIVVPAARERVWPVVTDPAELSGWLGARVDLDPRPGAAGTVEEPDGTRRAACVVGVCAPQRYSFEWWSAGEREAVSRVVIELTEVEGGTRVDVTESQQPVAVPGDTPLTPRWISPGVPGDREVPGSGEPGLRALAGR